MATVVALLPSTAYRSADLLAAAQRLGVQVIAVSDQHMPMESVRGERSITAPFDEPATAADRIAAALAELDVGIDAIIPIDDGGVVIAALVGSALGLPHNPEDSVAATRNKAVMRERLAASGIEQPRWAVADFAAFAERTGYPVVAKPVGLSGSRGVLRCDDAKGLAAAVATIGDIAGSDHPIIVEEFVEGPEISIDGVVTGGTFTPLAVMDKPDPLDGPTFEETLFITPSRHDPALVAAATAMTSRAVSALGLVQGPVHAEVRLAPRGPTMIEIAARPIGGLCGRALQFSVLGRSLEELLIRNALDMPLGDTSGVAAASGVAMVPIRASGTVVDYLGIDETKAIPHITGVAITANPGAHIQPLPHGDRYAAFVFARAQSPENVETALRQALATIKIVVED